MNAPINWTQVLANCTVYRARVGRRLPFKSEADALAYEHGYANPHAEHAAGTPADQGARDWHNEEDTRYSLRAEAAAERNADRWAV